MMKIKNINNTHREKDLYIGAFLYASGRKLLRLEWAGAFYWFVFEDKERCEELSNQYWSGEAVVNAKAYVDALRTLKDRLFAQSRRDGDEYGKFGRKS